MLRFRNSNTRVNCCKSVFQNNKYVNLSMKYINEIKECTVNLQESDRRDFFYAQGIHYDNVNKYYQYIKKLEDNWDRKSDVVVICISTIVNIIDNIRNLIIFHWLVINIILKLSTHRTY